MSWPDDEGLSGMLHADGAATASFSGGRALTVAELLYLAGEFAGLHPIELVLSPYLPIDMGPRWLDSDTIVCHPRAAYALGWTDDPAK